MDSVRAGLNTNVQDTWSKPERVVAVWARQGLFFFYVSCRSRNKDKSLSQEFLEQMKLYVM